MIVIPDGVQEIAGDALEGSPAVIICSRGSDAQIWAENHERTWIEKR